MNSKFIPYTDTQLWQAFKRGDEEAFDYMFEKHVYILYNYGRKFTTAAHVIEDCVQDLFVELWEKKKILGDTDSIKFYLFKALRLKIIRRLTQENKLELSDIDAHLYDFTVSLSHESALITHQQDLEQRKILTQAVDSLTKRQKEAIHLKYYDNLTYTEIAEIMAISVDSVYKLISGALAILKKHVRQVYLSLIGSSPFLYILSLLS